MGSTRTRSRGEGKGARPCSEPPGAAAGVRIVRGQPQPSVRKPLSRQVQVWCVCVIATLYVVHGTALDGLVGYEYRIHSKRNAVLITNLDRETTQWATLALGPFRESSNSAFDCWVMLPPVQLLKFPNVLKCRLEKNLVHSYSLFDQVF